MRQQFDLFVNLRPCKAYQGNPLNYRDDIDLIIFRENTEGLYVGMEWSPVPEDLWQAIKANSKKAAEFVQQFIRDLRQKHVPYRDFIIWKTLTKPAEEYAVNASHVEAAKMLRAKGWEISIGDKIGYVVVTGSGRLYERVKPYMFASYGEVDLEYYVTKQVIPAAARILESFGIHEEQLLAAKPEVKETKTLADFFGR